MKGPSVALKAENLTQCCRSGDICHCSLSTHAAGCSSVDSRSLPIELNIGWRT